MTDTIDISQHSKADVLRVLYDNSMPLGLGWMHYTPEPMTAEVAESIVAQTLNFDYLQGRVMKVDLAGNELDPWGYDRDNGQGAAARAIASLG